MLSDGDRGSLVLGLGVQVAVGDSWDGSLHRDHAAATDGEMG